jgi:cytidyltransferase-like protein
MKDSPHTSTLSDPMIKNAAAFPVSTVGGTFHALHRGHKEYLKIALEISDFVYVSVTSDHYAASLKSYEVQPFDVRCKEIGSFLASVGADERFVLHKLESEDELREFVFKTCLDVAVIEPRYLDLFQELNAFRRVSGADEYCILLKPRSRVGGVEVSSTKLQALWAEARSGTEVL